MRPRPQLPAAAAGTITLSDAVNQGVISVNVSGFRNISNPAYYGVGTMAIVNLTAQEQKISISSGIRFRNSLGGQCAGHGD